MRVITAPEEYALKDGDISVFLAGGIMNCPDWREGVIKNLEFMIRGDELVIFNPLRKNFPMDDPSASQKQIEWEYKALERCDIFSMYFSNGISDQPICMYELGRNIVRMQMKYPLDWRDRVLISVEHGYKRKQDVLIQTELACGNLFINTVGSEEQNPSVKRYHSIMIAEAYKKFSNRVHK